MDKPLLSICIPTYNRAHYLGRCLESIKIQLAANNWLNDCVEVVISDNCSQDKTKEVVERYRGDFNHFQYWSNQKNIGFDLNVCELIKNANGRYCWYLGDDDVIVNGGIEAVCKKLEGGQYDFVGVNAIPISEENNNKVVREYPNDSFIESTDFNDFYFKEYCQGGVSVLIFNREMWLKHHNQNDYLEHWLYYENVLKILPHIKNKMMFITVPTILTGQDCRWAENGTELFTYVNSNILIEKLINFGYNKKRITKILEDNSKKIALMVLRAKGHGLDCNIKNLKYIYKNMKRSGGFRLFLATLLYFIPNNIVVMVRDSRKKLAKLLHH